MHELMSCVWQIFIMVDNCTPSVINGCSYKCQFPFFRNDNHVLSNPCVLRCLSTWLSILMSEVRTLLDFRKQTFLKSCSLVLELELVNSSPPSATYMHQWTRSALFQIMACCLFGAKPLSKPMPPYCQLISWEQISVKFKSEFYHFTWKKNIWNRCLQKLRPFCAGKHELRVNSGYRNFAIGQD